MPADRNNIEADCVVIGAGIIGLAVAWTLRNERRVVVVDKEPAPALHQTGRNSGVIHSGVYYPPASLKALLCLEGKDLLERFCHDHEIPIRVTGKLIGAATAEEAQTLLKLAERGALNGIPGLELLEPKAVKAIEPAVDVVSGLLVPTTGLVDYRSVAAALAADIVASGGIILQSFEVVGIGERGISLVVSASDGRSVVASSGVNCAGLHSDRVAKLAGSQPTIRIVPFRGIYYDVVYRDLVARPIYPVPDPRFPFLGVHLTPTVDNRLTAGPNAVLALGREAYSWQDRNIADTVEMATHSGLWKLGRRYWKTGLGEVRRTLSRRAFGDAIRTLVPSFRDAWLRPAGSGIRAQAVEHDGQLVDDFAFTRSHNMVHVLNAPSPAATASLAIARKIAETLDGSTDFASVTDS